MRYSPILLTVVFVLIAGRASAAENLISNPGFEEASADDKGQPRAWTPQTSGNIDIAWSDTEAHGGTRSLAMLARPGEKYAHAFWTSGPITVKPGMAYCVSFYYKAEGHGVPIFNLTKVKEWRLSGGDTKGEWARHEDVVVVPPDAGDVRFTVHNYNRPGKRLWLDDVSLVELPLTESPVTARLHRAESGLKTLKASLAALELDAAQRNDLVALEKHLAAVRQGYAVLESGTARAEDFKALLDGLDALERGFGPYRFLVWVIEPAQWERTGYPRPTRFAAPASQTLTISPGQTRTLYLGVQNMLDVGLPGAVRLETPPRPSGWKGQLAVTPATQVGSGAPPWGELNRLGEVYLPPAVPRYVRIEITAPEAKPGEYPVKVEVTSLDRLAEATRFEITVSVPKAP